MSQKQITNTYINANLSPKKLELIKKSPKTKQLKQNFDQVIKQMKQQKQSIKNKSHLSSNLSNNKQQSANPQKKQDNNSVIERMFYTQTFRAKMEARLSQIEERKKQLNARSLQKQMKARLLRKIHQNVELKGKMDLLKDIQHRRQLLLIEKSQREKKRKQQLNLLHQSNLVNAEMFRKTKLKVLKKQLNESRFKQQESLKDLKFKNYLQEKQKQSRLIILNSRNQLRIRSNSERRFSRGDFASTNHSNRKTMKSVSREIKTSQLNRGNNKGSQAQEDEQLIIQQYCNNKKQSSNDAQTTSSGRVQKKYNQTVRKSECQSNECQDLISQNRSEPKAEMKEQANEQNIQNDYNN